MLLLSSNVTKIMAVIKYELYPKPHKLSHFVDLHYTVCNKNEWRSSKWQEKGPKNLRILHCRPFFSERNVKQTQTSCNSVLTHFFSALISFESLFAIFFLKLHYRYILHMAFISMILHNFHFRFMTCL